MLRIYYFIHCRRPRQSYTSAVSRFYSHKEAKKECKHLNRQGRGAYYFIKPKLEEDNPNSKETFMSLVWQCLNVPVMYYGMDGTVHLNKCEEFKLLEKLDARIKFSREYLAAHPQFKPDAFFLEFFNTVSEWRQAANELFLTLVRDDENTPRLSKELKERRMECEDKIRKSVIEYTESLNKKFG